MNKELKRLVWKKFGDHQMEPFVRCLGKLFTVSQIIGMHAYTHTRIHAYTHIRIQHTHACKNTRLHAYTHTSTKEVGARSCHRISKRTHYTHCYLLPTFWRTPIFEKKYESQSEDTQQTYQHNVHRIYGRNRLEAILLVIKFINITIYFLFRSYILFWNENNPNLYNNIYEC